MGWHRRRFLHESLVDLRQQLSNHGLSLIEVWGEPEDVLPRLMEDCGADALFFSRECAPEEQTAEEVVRAAVTARGGVVRSGWSQLLFELGRLPFEISAVPQVFTLFRQRVEAMPVDTLASFEPLPFLRPRHLHPLPIRVPPGLRVEHAQAVVCQHVLGQGSTCWWQPVASEAALLKKNPLPSHAGKPEVSKQALAKGRVLHGGTTGATRRLQDYLFESDSASRYFETRNGLLSPMDSTLFSAWLANGSLSPRHVVHQIRELEAQRGQSKGSYWIVFELLWREFFKLHLLGAGERFFYPAGIFGSAQASSVKASDTDNLCQRIMACDTGKPFVDANLRELIHTGFMSNRGRQIVASHLVHGLGLPWVAGASIFESLLIDYDVASNWGNWAYVAGVNFDPRGGRHFNVEKQQEQYDPGGLYLAAWSGH